MSVLPGVKHPLTQVAQTMLDLCEEKIKEVEWDCSQLSLPFVPSASVVFGPRLYLFVCLHSLFSLFVERGSSGAAGEGHQPAAG